MTKDNEQNIPSVEVQSSLQTQTEIEARESLIEFPTRFPIKAIGKHTVDFKQAVATIVSNTIADKDLIDIEEQFSSNERYLSITIIATFYEQSAIDVVYQALTDEPLVIMAL